MTGTICLVEHNQPPGNTLELIRAARRRGHDVLVASADPESAREALPGDVEVLSVDTTDGAAIASAVDPRGLVGLTTAHDFYVPAAADAAARLGLPGPDTLAVRRCRRKDLQRVQLAANGVCQPRFGLARSPQEAVAVAESIGFPVVVKPVALADSIGVVLCESVEAVAAHVGLLAGDARFRPRRPAPGHVAGEVLVESVLSGPEFTVEVFAGRAVSVARTHLAPPPGFVEAEHVVEAPGEQADAHALLKQTAEQAVEALGLGFGAVHVELRVGDSGPAVIEVNARLAGGRLPRLYQLTHRIDLWDASLGAALGEDVRPATAHDRAGVLRFVQVANTRPQTTAGVTHRGFDGELVLFAFTPSVGDRPTRSSEHAGWAIATGATADDARRQLDALWAQLARQLPLWRPGVSERE